MKFLTYLLAACIGCSVHLAADAAASIDRSKKAFPTAEGFGAYSKGGTGGKIITVTTLDDDQNKEGSLRWALQQPGPIIIQFAVEGIIDLQKNLSIQSPFITIDGSTAPGKGITLKDGTLAVEDTHDVIIRYIRVRPGDEVALRKGIWKKQKRTNLPNDAIGVRRSSYVIIDHCSGSWGSDEVISVTDSENVTVQWCMICEPLANPQLHIENKKPQSHPFGAIVSGNGISYIKNLIAYYSKRGPELTSDNPGKMEAVNNFIYAFGESGSKVKPGPNQVLFHLVNNSYEHRLDPKAPDILIFYETPKPPAVSPGTKVYLSGNIGPQRSNPSSDEWSGIASEFPSSTTASLRSDKPLFQSPIALFPTQQVKSKILQDVGATLPAIDAIDQRIRNQIAHGTGNIINSQDDVGGYQ